MAFTFPASPSVNDTHTVGSRIYTWTGTKWVLSGGIITATQLEANSVTTAKIADANVTTAKVAANAITQAKLASNLSAVTVTTTVNRNTDIPSPFTGQLIVLTDTKKIQLWDGTAWLSITMAPPEVPTSLSAIASTTSVAISFTLGADNGSPISNHKYALSTDGGSAYGSFIALNPVDATSPITISGLSMNTEYYVKIKTVNGIGDSVASSAVSFTTEGVPGAPTSLSVSSVVPGGAVIAFTAGAENGLTITNYKFSSSTDNVTYSSYTALNPVDATSPITVYGLASNTLNYVKLKAVNGNGDSPASAAVSFTTPVSVAIDWLVVAGGAGGGSFGGGNPYGAIVGSVGSNSTFSSTTVVGGGGGASGSADGANGGSGGGASTQNPGAGTTNQGYAGGQRVTGTVGNVSHIAGGGGGAGAVGGNGINATSTAGSGGAGIASSITGSSVTYGGGGGGAGQYNFGTTSGGAGGSGGGGAGGYANTGGGSVVAGVSGSSNTGAGGGAGYQWGGPHGGGGAGGVRGTLQTGGGGTTSNELKDLALSTNYSVTVGAGGAARTAGINAGDGASGGGGSGVVIFRYPDTRAITVGAGLTASHTNASAGAGYKYTRLTAGSGNVSWT